LNDESRNIGRTIIFNPYSLRSIVIFGVLKTLFYIFLALPHLILAQFPGPAGTVGSTAIHKDDVRFKGWVSSCVLHLGPQNITVSGSPLAQTGDHTSVIGKATENGVVSLGDGGYADCTFDLPITNLPGFDFAVFENAFNDSYLEFAFVEVSSDGINFFRFPAQCELDSTIQIGPFDTCDTRKVNNLAGKYRTGYGTPFDLEELKDINGLDINKVTHVRIRDVVGSINKNFCTRDNLGRIINDPWPTDFNASGFELDAIGVMHLGIAGMNENTHPNLFPSTLKSQTVYEIKPLDRFFKIYDLAGRIVMELKFGDSFIPELPAGLYIISDGQTHYRINVLDYQ